MDFTQFNKKIAVFTNAEKDLPFFKIDDVTTGVVYKVNGLFAVNGKYGLRYFASLERAGSKFNFDLPTGANETCNSICSNAEGVAEINAGRAGLVISTYHSKKYNRDCVNIEWVNIEEVPF